MNWFLLFAALAPALFMMHFIYVRDKYERDPLWRVLLVYFVSFLTVIPAAMFEGVFSGIEKWGLIGVAISVWCVIALSEETVKYLAIRLLAVPMKSFNEVYDGILYGVAASLGFATVENLAYVFLSHDQGLTVALARAVLSVPGHALWGVMMGYYIGVAKFTEDPHKKRALVWKGLLIAIFWHGLYDFFAFGVDKVGDSLSLVFACCVVLVILVNWIIATRLIHLAQAQSVFKRPSPMLHPLHAFAPQYKFCHNCGTRALRAQPFCMSCGQQYPE
jgi:protease PrsW